MATRDVELRLTSTGFDAIQANLDKLDATLDRIKAKFDDLNGKNISPNFKTDGLDRASAELDKFSAKLDELSHKNVTAKVSVDIDSGKLKRSLDAAFGDVKKLLGRLGGGGGGGKGLVQDLEGAGEGGGGGGGGIKDILSSLGGASNYITGTLIAAALVYGASLLPAVVPLSIGALVGGGAGAGAFAIGSSDNAALQALEQSLSGTKGKQRQQILAQIAAMKKNDAGFLSVYGAGAKVGKTGESAFLNALTSPGYTGTSERAGNKVGGDITTPSFLQSFTGILSQIDRFIGRIGPSLGNMFRSSIPYLQVFVQFMEQLAKSLLPAFTQSMKAFQPDLPIIASGLKILAQGLADFIKDLGPGMKDGAIIFKGTMMAVKGLLIGLAFVADGLAIAFVKIAEYAKDGATGVRSDFDALRHWIATTFDNIRHDVAASWDALWNNTIGRMQRGANDVGHWISNMRHSIANIYDGIRHDVASDWNTMWNNTVGRVERGVTDVGHTIATLRNKIRSALGDAETILYNDGKAIIDGALNGIKAAAGGLLSFVGGLASKVASAFADPLHIKSPSRVFVAYGMEIVNGLVVGVQNKAGTALAAMQGLGKKMAAQYKAALSFANSTTSSIEQGATLGGLTGNGPVTAQGIEAGMQHYLSQIRQFGAAIKRLSADGLNKTLLMQLIQLGPFQGLAAARALADGPMSVIKSLNKTENQITGAANWAGKQSANAIYGVPGMGSAGLSTIQLEWVGGGDSEFITWLKKQIRIRGGNPGVLGR